MIRARRGRLATGRPVVALVAGVPAAALLALAMGFADASMEAPR